MSIAIARVSAIALVGTTSRAQGGFFQTSLFLKVVKALPVPKALWPAQFHTVWRINRQSLWRRRWGCPIIGRSHIRLGYFDLPLPSPLAPIKLPVGQPQYRIKTIELHSSPMPSLDL